MRRFYLSAVAALLAAAACTPKPSQTTTAAAVDTAAALRGIDSTRARYAALQLAGDATGLAGLYTEDATQDVFGMPRTRGRAAIEAGFKTEFAARKFTVAEINPVQTMVRTNQNATEIGTYHDLHDVSGVKDHEWGRFVVGLLKGADGVWRLTYVMAFPDSTKVEK
jgi:uncharacterized protein (TIGR02246 family)